MAFDGLFSRFSDLRKRSSRRYMRLSGTAGREKNYEHPATAPPAAQAA